MNLLHSLYGPLHGGANEAVIRMLTDIGSPDNVPEFMEQVKRKEKVLSGFGHRVYRTTDPRSFIIRKTAEEVSICPCNCVLCLCLILITVGTRFSKSLDEINFWTQRSLFMMLPIRMNTLSNGESIIFDVSCDPLKTSYYQPTERKRRFL
jgi:hypothetical protein